MSLSQQPSLAQVTYRATVGGGREAEIRFEADPAAASLADAWARFTARYAEVDPRSLEIEIREPRNPVPAAADAPLRAAEGVATAS